MVDTSEFNKSPRTSKGTLEIRWKLAPTSGILSSAIRYFTKLASTSGITYPIVDRSHWKLLSSNPFKAGKMSPNPTSCPKVSNSSGVTIDNTAERFAHVNIAKIATTKISTSQKYAQKSTVPLISSDHSSSSRASFTASWYTGNPS